ncbi:MAG: hypothetical protein Q9209_001930 [Squamulea sp. 1 TL-2023]
MDGLDDRPLALRRKRRASSALADPADKEVNSQPTKEDTATQDAPREPPKTPGNRKKKTRFSDSVVEIGARTTIDLTQEKTLSTGLTPALNRTILIPIKSTERVKKRLSLPEQLMTPVGSRSASGSFLSTSPIEIQFAPLSQKISDRTMRHLRRNHLSETTNEIHEDNKRSKKTLQEEVEELRVELALARQRTNGASNGPSATNIAPEDSARVAELEDEISELKQEMREQSTTVELSNPRTHNNRSSVAPPTLFERSSLSPPVPVELDISEDIGQNQYGVVDLAGAKSQSDRSNSPVAVSVVEASTQTSHPSPALSEVLRSARLQFEHLFPGETTIGLEISDPEPFIKAMISRAESLKKEADRLDQNISVSETSRLNTKNNFDRALQQLELHRTQIQVLKATLEEEKKRANSAELEISTLEAHVENAESKYTDLKKQRDDHQRSIERLQDALKHYRKEAEKLTRTVLQMESSHETALANLRSEYQASNATALAARDVIFDEIVSDLEAQVDAQKNGRLKAEQSAVERLERIRELKNRKTELKKTVNQKQDIIRQLETQIEQTKSGHESEVGQLNVRIGELVSNISSANAELAKVRQESSRLSKLVEDEKAAGLKAVESMQSEMKQCANKVNVVKDDHAEGVKKRGEQIAQSFGLITPVVEGGRFRNAEADEKVEGHVELTRGKAKNKRPDSGVGMWGLAIEEEEEQEDGDGDVVMEDPEVTTAHGLGNDSWASLMD